MDSNNSTTVTTSSNASNGSTVAESYLDKLLSSAATKIKLNSLNFIDTQSIQDKMKFKLCNTETADMTNCNYLPKLSRKEMMTPLDEYLSLPRVKLDDYSKSINQMLSQKIEDILKNNIQVLLLGAGIGAAVTTGVALGLVCVGSIIQTSIISNWWESITHKIKRGVSFSKLNYEVEKETKDKTLGEREIHDDAPRRNGRYKLTVIQGKPVPQVSSSLKTIQDQCSQCLQSISSKLDSLKLNWNDVIKMNVMIVSGKCKASTVRKMLDEYIPGSIPTLSIAYVMELENELSSIEMEVWLDLS